MKNKLKKAKDCFVSISKKTSKFTNKIYEIILDFFAKIILITLSFLFIYISYFYFTENKYFYGFLFIFFGLFILWSSFPKTSFWLKKQIDPNNKINRGLPIRMLKIIVYPIYGVIILIVIGLLVGLLIGFGALLIWAIPLLIAIALVLFIIRLLFWVN